MTVRAVVFDIGNVLIEWQPERFFDRVIGEARRVAFFDAVPFHTITDGIDRGEPLDAAVDRAIAAYPDWADELVIWKTRWIEIAAPAIDHSVRLLRALRRAGHPVYALSNFGKDTLKLAEAEYPFLEEFDRRYISGQLGVIKPEAAIYEAVEADVAFSPSALLFADDLQRNIDAAHARGWQTHLFDGPQRFATRLVAEGLLSEDAAQ